MRRIEILMLPTTQMTRSRRSLNSSRPHSPDSEAESSGNRSPDLEPRGRQGQRERGHQNSEQDEVERQLVEEMDVQR